MPVFFLNLTVVNYEAIKIKGVNRRRYNAFLMIRFFSNKVNFSLFKVTAEVEERIKYGFSVEAVRLIAYIIFCLKVCDLSLSMVESFE